MDDRSGWEDPDDPAALPPRAFIDRVSEAHALAAALVQHRARIDADTVSTRELRNVLTYFGNGGVGKSELSARLATWLQQDAEVSVVEDWGPRPDIPVHAVVRWDVNDSHGALDVVELLARLRTQLGAIQRTWPAFDLAFAEFFRMMRPGSDLRLRSPGHVETTLSEIVGGLFGDVVGLTDLAVTGGVSAGGFGIARRVLSGAYASARARRTFARFRQLEGIIRDCEDLPGPSSHVATIAARIGFLLSEEIHRLPPTDRPLVVVFVDHVERVQVPGREHVGESALNRLVARLPYFLFVVTGRNSLRWQDADATYLPERGTQKWPLLGTDPTPSDEPHQHLVGNLSEADSKRFLREAFDSHGIRVEAGLVEDLAHATDGWPLHLDTLVAVARERADHNRYLTVDDLAGKLPRLVDRLLNDLPTDQEQAFRAACLLPYFDVEFVAAAGDIPRGAVERLTRRTIVRPNFGSPYPFRIHDTLRELVRASGSDSHGGWSASDWTPRAERALSEANRRFESAMQSGDDLGAIASLALGLNVAAENGVSASWLVPAIRRSPSIQGLAVMLPTTNPAAATADLQDILAFLRLRTPSREDVTEDLRQLVARRTSIASTAGLWRAYDLRFQGRHQEALAQLDQLILEFNDRPNLYRYQKAVTLRIARRFRDAIAYLDDLDASQRERHISSIERSHGKIAGADQLRQLALRQESRRFQLELLADWLVVQNRETGVSADVAVDLYEQADLIGHNVAKASIAGVIGQNAIFDDTVFKARAAELEGLSNRRSRPYVAWSMLLAMRAWACNEPHHAIRAHAIASGLSYRSQSYIPVEILLEHLGYPLPIQETQWLEPYDEVRDRWLQVLTAVKERALTSLS